MIHYKGGIKKISSKNTYVQKILKRVVAGIIVIIFLDGCTLPSIKSTGPQEATDQPLELDVGKRMPFTPGKKERPLEMDVSKRMFLVPEEADKKKPEQSYKFRAKDMSIVMALDLFAHDNDLNIISSPDVTGAVTVDFKGLPFKQAMEAILDAHGYYWSKEDSLIRVYKYETKLFTVDYIRLIREGRGTSQASITSSAGGERAGEIAITQSDTIKFWDDLEAQLNTLVSEEGRVTINRTSGTIQVTDFHKKVVHMERFISSITKSIKRQVQIEVKILEVLLNDEFSLGIDWDVIVNRFMGIDGATASTIITSPFGGGTADSSTVSLNLGLFGGNSEFDVIVEALSEQGELKVISRPTIRVVNNQPALIKVGTDRPFFNQTTTVDQGVQQTTEEVEFITEGLVLSITPQISGDGWIMLDVTPIISRLVDTVQSTLGSTAPMMDVKQSSTVVRIKDGEMVTVGGLIQDEDSKTTRKVPLLGDIPIIGNVFKGTYTATRKSELVIFITPKIIKD